MDQIKIVDSIPQLAKEKFDDKVNIILLRRRLKGNFNKLAKALLEHVGDAEGAELDFAEIRKPSVIEDCIAGAPRAVWQAGQQVITDMKALGKKYKLALRITTRPEQDDNRRFHTDEIPKSVLCCYTVAATQWKTHQGKRRVFALGDIWRHATEADAPRATPLNHSAPRWPQKPRAPRMILINL